MIPDGQEGEPFAQFLHSRRLAYAHRHVAGPHAQAAMRWLNRSAHSGFPPAMHLLGKAHASGDGIQLSLRAAVHWLDRAALWTALWTAPSAQHVHATDTDARGEAETGGGAGAEDSAFGAKGCASPLTSLPAAAPAGLGPVVSSRPGLRPGLVGGPTISSRAAFDLAKLLLHGEEYGWPSPLNVNEPSPWERAQELLVRASEDGHAHALKALNALTAPAHVVGSGT
jgi:TPR repeat protein